MAIPKYNEFMKPMLRILSDGKTHRVKDIQEQLADEFRLSPEDRVVKIPSGKTLLYKNRIGWAASYMLQAKLIKSHKRGEYTITDAGSHLLKQNPEIIGKDILMRYPSFVEFQNRSKVSKKNEKVDDKEQIDVSEDQTPEATINEAYQKINQALSDELLLEIINQTPDFFEQMVVDLLKAMGYGGTTADMAKVIGKTGDEGIDGIIKEDKLGFNSIYIQAKRWDLNTTISRAEIQKFVGALAGQGATKGLFITTASFSNGAINYASKQHATKVVLVDGQMLASLMIEHDLGVSTKIQYKIKSVDIDYFREDE